MSDTFVTITGWVGGAVTIKDAGEHKVASFRLANTPRRFRDGAWVNDTTIWYTVKAWRRLGEHVARCVGSGHPVVVHGRLVLDTWTNKEGQLVTNYVVVATSVGHDLNFGVSQWHKAVSPGSAESADSPGASGSPDSHGSGDESRAAPAA